VPGTLCVFSEAAQELSPGQVDMLEVLPRQVVELLELQHRTAQLDRAYVDLEESNSRLAGFAGRVNHDLRTPLTTMLGYLEMLQDDPEIRSVPGAADDLDKVGASGRRTRPNSAGAATGGQHSHSRPDPGHPAGVHMWPNSSDFPKRGRNATKDGTKNPILQALPRPFKSR
jgi:His Kinase A (phospho-acceptor) domain